MKKKLVSITLSAVLAMSAIPTLPVSAADVVMKYYPITLPDCILNLNHNYSYYIITTETPGRFYEGLYYTQEDPSLSTENIQFWEVCPPPWGLYLLQDYPDSDTKLPQWVEANLENWNCEFVKASKRFNADHILVYPSSRLAIAEQLEVFDRIYHELGYGLTQMTTLDGEGISLPAVGDADSDGQVTLKDAMAVQKHYNLTEVLGEDGILTDEQIAAADVNADGKTDTKDAMCIMKFCHFRDMLEEPKTWAEITGK